MHEAQDQLKPHIILTIRLSFKPRLNYNLKETNKIISSSPSLTLQTGRYSAHYLLNQITQTHRPHILTKCRHLIGNGPLGPLCLTNQLANCGPIFS